MFDEFKPVTPEITVRNTISDLKSRIRGLEDEINLVESAYKVKRKFLEEKMYEFTNALDAWNKVLETMKNGG